MFQVRFPNLSTPATDCFRFGFQIFQLRQQIVLGSVSKSFNSGNRLFWGTLKFSWYFSATAELLPLVVKQSSSFPQSNRGKFSENKCCLRVESFCFVYPNHSTPATDCFWVPSNFPGTFRRLRNSSLWSSNSPRRSRKVTAENSRKTNVALELKVSVLFTQITQLRQPIVFGYPQIFLVLFGDCGTPPFCRQTVLVVSEK